MMPVKMHIKLNLKWLYQADGYAVQELLKVATSLWQVMPMQCQVSPQPRKMPPQVLAIQQVTEIVRTIEAPALQVHTPGLPSRKRVCMHEDQASDSTATEGT